MPFGEGVSYAKTVFYSLTPMNLQYGLDTCARPVSEYPGDLPGFVSELGFTHFAENVYERTAEDFPGKTVSCAAPTPLRL